MFWNPHKISCKISVITLAYWLKNVHELGCNDVHVCIQICAFLSTEIFLNCWICSKISIKLVWRIELKFLRRTSEHNQSELFSLKKNYFSSTSNPFLKKKTGSSLIDFDVIIPMQSSKFTKSLNFGSNSEKIGIKS